MKRVALAALLFPFAFAACGNGNGNAAAPPAPVDESCSVVDASACGPPPVSYAKDLAPIFDKDCNRTCHAPGNGPWPLDSYDSVAGWTDLITVEVAGCSMPPPDGGAMTTADRTSLLNWIACGAPDN